ncbi:MAG: class I tRNA ligase family protein, partial [Candidatus Gracilibacteria bacterium]
RFVQKLWAVVTADSVPMISPALLRKLHLTLKRVTGDIEIFHFNTAISGVMEFLNEAGHEGLDQKSKEIVVKMMAPLAPHLAEELWMQLQGVATTSKKWASVFDQKFPTYDASLTVSSTMDLVVQVNGKVRCVLQVPKDISKEDAFKAAQADESVKRNLEGKTIVKEIFVPGRLVNFVVR